MSSRSVARLPALGLLAPLLLAGCSAGGGSASAQELGPQATRDYGLNGFDRIELKGSDSITVHIGPAFAVRAQAPQGVLDRLELTVEGGALKVGRRSDSADWGGRSAAAKITVTLPALAGATVAGSGDMAVDTAGGAAFTGAVTGSGDLTVSKLEAPAATLTIAGSGDLTARGRIGRGDYSVAGSGDLHAGDLDAEAIRASTAGSGDIDAKASREASVSIVGSGDVTVGGGARCTISKVGSGEAKCG